MVSLAKLNSAGRLKPPLKIALAEAGVTVKPLSERTWIWLKEHPKSTVNACADSIKDARGNVSSAMSMLWRRDMVTFTEDFLDKSKPNRRTRLYTAKGKNYEILPIVRESSRPSKKHAKKEQEPEQVVILPSLPEPVALSLDERMESLTETLTIKEARCLYEKLKALLLV